MDFFGGGVPLFGCFMGHLAISAKDGVQAQTRILFHALRKMNIPTVIFINKIDQAGVDLQSVVQSVR